MSPTVLQSVIKGVVCVRGRGLRVLVRLRTGSEGSLSNPYKTIDSFIENQFMTSIAANDLKTNGVSVVEFALQQDGAVVMTVRGERTYVALNFNTYNKLREYE